PHAERLPFSATRTSLPTETRSYVSPSAPRWSVFIDKGEVARAFSGHAVYRPNGRTKSGILSFVSALIWRRHTYVGVWGRKNASRFRRFLRERGAEIQIHRHAPSDIRLAYWTTANERRRVRSLPQSQA